MIRCSIALSAALFMTACASPEAQLRSGLTNAGLSQPMAKCMAGQMIDRLSLIQLRRLGSLGNFNDEAIGDMTVERFLRNIRALKDPEVLTVTTKAALGCAISS